MYHDGDDYMKQIMKGFYSSVAIEPVSDRDVSGMKARQFVARTRPISALPYNYEGLGGQDLLNTPGEHAYTVVPVGHGFYVLIYFAPGGGYEKYRKLYDQMVASFEPFKDGPLGQPLPGKIAAAMNPDEVLKQYVSQFQAKKATLFGPAVVRYSPVMGGFEKKVFISGWFDTAPLQMEKNIISLVSRMKSPPAIPDEATRDFVKAATFMNEAKDASDYEFAIDAYKKALFNAPWWGDAYYNLGVAFEAAGLYDDALESMRLYLLANPASAPEDKKRIYAIEAKQEKAAKAAAAMRAKYGETAESGQFDINSLYRYGAVVQDMSFDNTENARTISLKVATRKENGSLVDYLTIFDITEPSDVFGRKYSVDWTGEETFFLDDRSSPGRESMTLSIASFSDGDADIMINSDGHSSASIQSSLVELLRERARQALYAGYKMTVGEKMFYVLGQGGAKGSLLFFPADIKDKIELGKRRDLSPTFVAIINSVGPSGQIERFNTSDLGVLKGTHYYLEFDGAIWVPKIGQGPHN